ncbi:MAG: 2-C-methyl-D-erythritol 4-phosphate cytidylyltransferase [Oscillospiraceae bacterium]|nr:2-C-methyl-D-erythritol 4-phosphate cytidylyltransferase [Oscillospiraceae bacterium]
MNAMLLMMGGTGTRFGKDRPKQYTLIDDRPLFSYIVEKADKTACIDRLVVVSHADWLDYAQEWCEKFVKRIPFDVVAGGENRSGSVLNGLTRLGRYAKRDDVVLIHDATHPYLDPEGVGKVVEAVQEYGGATMASRNYDTVYRTDEQGFLEKVEPREQIVAGASPEAFRFGDIYDIYRNASAEELASMTSAGAIALSHNIPMKVIGTPVLNLKITYEHDLDLFLKLIHGYFFD